MTKLIGFIVVLFLTFNSFAASRVRFMPLDRHMIVNITERDLYGNTDTDPMDLYLTMNVEEQHTNVGTGKSIITPEKDFTLTCIKEKKGCTIVLMKSEHTTISSARKYATLKLTGEEARELTQKFKLNDRGEAHFTATDKAWRLFGNSDTFFFEATGSEP